MVPGGVRIGSPAMTTRGMVESDFVKVADFIDRCAARFRTVATLSLLSGQPLTLILSMSRPLQRLCPECTASSKTSCGIVDPGTAVVPADALLTFVVMLCRGIKLTAQLKKSTPGAAKMKDFTAYLMEQKDHGEVKELADEVVHFASSFPMPGL